MAQLIRQVVSFCLIDNNSNAIWKRQQAQSVVPAEAWREIEIWSHPSSTPAQSNSRHPSGFPIQAPVPVGSITLRRLPWGHCAQTLPHRRFPMPTLPWSTESPWRRRYCRTCSCPGRPLHGGPRSPAKCTLPIALRQLINKAFFRSVPVIRQSTIVVPVISGNEDGKWRTLFSCI